jgi:hypothetical protein
MLFPDAALSDLDAKSKLSKIDTKDSFVTAVKWVDAGSGGLLVVATTAGFQVCRSVVRALSPSPPSAPAASGCRQTTTITVLRGRPASRGLPLHCVAAPCESVLMCLFRCSTPR